MDETVEIISSDSSSVSEDPLQPERKQIIIRPVLSDEEWFSKVRESSPGFVSSFPNKFVHDSLDRIFKKYTVMLKIGTGTGTNAAS
jgi:hypothetical protein